MIRYIVYATDSGEIGGFGAFEDGIGIDELPIEQGFAYMVIDDMIDIDSYYVKDGELVKISKRPSPFYHIVSGEWMLSEEMQNEISTAERKQALDNLDWMTTRHRDQRDAAGPTTLTEEEYAELLNYKQELRDWTNGPLPEPPVWMN